MAKGFRYEFTGNEFFYFLFKKKICPKCGGKMTKNKSYEIIDGHTLSVRSVNYGKKEMKRYFYAFTCEKCGSEFKLNELAK